MQFRITTCDGSSEWMNCKDWSIDAMEAMADDLNVFYGNDWQMEFRSI